jgi:mono/diheme cytochrome c family protein
VQKGPNKILGIVSLIALIVIGATAASVYWLRARAYQGEQRAAELTGGDPGRGPEMLRQYGCVACHTVRGVAAPGGLLGPNLSNPEKFLTRNPQQLIDFIVNPKATNPKTVMPLTGISEAQARDVAAYLLSQR